MSRVMFSLPDDLVSRMRHTIPDGERSRLIADFLEKEICQREQSLFESALLLESNQALTNEMKALEDEFGQDGLDHV